MRFADTYVATIGQACDEAVLRATNPAVRLTALQWKLQQGTAAYNAASGQNPVLNALDILVLTTMARIVVEDYAMTNYGPQALPLLEAQRSQESNAWTLAGRILKPAQENELKDLILEWRKQNPHQLNVGPIHFGEFVTALGRTPTQSSSAPTSIFSLLYLDPLAGLDPTAAAIEETRELGERAMYYTQRMPTLLNWQAQVLVLQLSRQPESKQILANANQLASSAEVFAETARQLPQLINDQRHAAIQQVLDGLMSQADKSSEILTNARSTLQSAGEAATNINTAIKSLSDFVRSVTPTNSATSADTNSRPFDVLDYARTATQVAAAASNLTLLLASANQSAPAVEKLGQQTADSANRVVQRAFRLGLILISVFLVGAFVVALAYRLVANALIKK